MEKWEALRRVRCIANYQFGKGLGEKLFPEDATFEFSRKTGDVRHIYVKGVRVATLRPKSGTLSLTIEGAKRLMEAAEYKRYWVKVNWNAAPYVAKGRSVFAKHVIDADKRIRPGEEVAVLNPNNEVIAVGKALLTGREMLYFKQGVAVKIRVGKETRKKKHV